MKSLGKTLAGKIKRHRLLFLMFIPIVLLVLSLPLGRYPISLSELVLVLIERIFGVEYNLPSVLNTIIFEIRLPRIIGAMIIGGSLSVAGSSCQAIFNNPLVSPDILGVSAGAGFGAAIAILLSWNIIGIQTASFVAGLLAVIITYFVSTLIKQGNQTLLLVLIGIIVGTVFSSLISLIKYIADPFDKLPAITFWLMGSLSTITNKEISMITPSLLMGLIPLYLIRWRLNVLSLGDEEAETLGVNTKKIRLLVIIATTLLTASTVAISGVIGWVGLLIPHIARLLVGPNYEVLIPASFLIGSSYLLLVDTIARILLSMEIPLGILTSLIGAPFFIWVLYIRREER